MQGDMIDIGHELAEARVGAFHWRLCAVIAALAFFDGYDVFNPAYVIHYVMGPWGMRPAQAGLLVSSGLLGFMLGAAASNVRSRCSSSGSVAGTARPATWAGHSTAMTRVR